VIFVFESYEEVTVYVI